jgi:cyclopropane fatty-acyl-phospholipid synthase-like methyltransferase
MEHKEYKELHAEWYELWSGRKDQSKEFDYWTRTVEAYGEPVLELGSGWGKIQHPLLERGFDVVGIDTSDDMMARCRTTCEARGLKPELYEQSMVEFDLPREFALIIGPSGLLGLFTSDQDITATFHRVMAHLKPGGTFIYGFSPVPDEQDKGITQENNSWSGNWVRGPDDVVITWRIQSQYDPSTHTWEGLWVFEKFIGGELVKTEANEREGRLFTVDEAVQYAESAGFEVRSVKNFLTDDPPTTDADTINIVCRKPVG